LRAAAHQHGFVPAVVEQQVDWARRFILFHGKKHPETLGVPEVGQFLDHVCQTVRDPLPHLNAARDALLFLYRQLLQRDLGDVPLPAPPRLLDQVRHVLRLGHYSLRTEECYAQWITRFILFHHKRHPRDMGAAEIEQFLSHLAVEGHVSASTQNQALNALVFLYKRVLQREVGPLDAVRAYRSRRLPVVLSPEEVAVVLAQVSGANGAYRLLADLLYGSGLRQMEACRLRVKVWKIPVRSFPGAHRPHALANHAGTDHEVQFVHQAVGKQVVPEEVTAEYQNFPTRRFFECGDLRVRVRAPNDARRAPPLDLVGL
jgi:integrase